MPYEKVEFSFPDPDEDKKTIEIEPSSAMEVDISGKSVSSEEAPESESTEDADDGIKVEIVDDTPKVDRGRKASEPPEDVTEEELEDYSDKVRKRIKHFNKGYHDERRAKETAP